MEVLRLNLPIMDVVVPNKHNYYTIVYQKSHHSFTHVQNVVYHNIVLYACNTTCAYVRGATLAL